MSFGPLPLESFLDRLAGTEPTPGGGTASAVAGALACALAELVLGLTLGREKFKAAEPELAPLLSRARAMRAELLRLADEDSRAYEGFVAAARLPKATPQEQAARRAAMAEAALRAAEVPLRTQGLAVEALRVLGACARLGNPSARSDAEVGSLLAWSAAHGARANVLVNLPGLGDEPKAADLRRRAEDLGREADALLQGTRGIVWD